MDVYRGGGHGWAGCGSAPPHLGPVSGGGVAACYALFTAVYVTPARRGEDVRNAIHQKTSWRPIVSGREGGCMYVRGFPAWKKALHLKAKRSYFQWGLHEYLDYIYVSPRLWINGLHKLGISENRNLFLRAGGGWRGGRVGWGGDRCSTRRDTYFKGDYLHIHIFCRPFGISYTFHHFLVVPLFCELCCTLCFNLLEWNLSDWAENE